MSKKAKAFLVLWRMGRVSETALRQAVEDGILTETEVEAIMQS